MTLPARLVGLTADEQGALMRKEAPTAAPEELIEALRVPDLGEWAKLHIVYELSHRDISLVECIARSLLTNPLEPGTGELAEALVQILDREPDTQSYVVRTLIEAGNAALDAGGTTYDVGRYVTHLADCVSLIGPLPETVPLARRLLDVAATEVNPYLFAIGSARRLVDEQPN